MVGDLRHRRRRGARGHPRARRGARGDGRGQRPRDPLHDRHRRVREIAAAAAARGVDVIDAPVSGGGAAAAAGRLTVYVGGAEAAVARARPVLETYGDPVLHMGRARQRAADEADQQRAQRRALRARARRDGARRRRSASTRTSLGDALRIGSGRSFSLEVFVGPRLVRRDRRPRRPDHGEGHRPVRAGDAHVRPTAPTLLDVGRPVPRAARPPRAGRRRAGGAPMSAARRRGRASTPAPGRSGCPAAVDPAGVLGRRLVRRARRATARGPRPTPSASTSRPSRSRSTAWPGPCAAVPTASRSSRASTRTSHVAIDAAAFADLVVEARTALGLVIGGRVAGDPEANEAFCAWDPVLRSVLDGRAVYRPGDVTLHAADGAPARPRPAVPARRGARRRRALPRRGRVPPARRRVHRRRDGRGRRRPRARGRRGRPDDGTSWWAATRDGTRYPCRILDFARRSDALRGALRRPALPRDRRAPRRRAPPRRPVRRALRRSHRRGPGEAGRFGRGPRLPAVAQGLRPRRPLDVLLGSHDRDLPDAGRRRARRPRRDRGLPPGEHRASPGRRRPRPPRGHPARRARRRDRAPLVHAAPFDAPDDPRAPRRLHRLHPAASTR